jgi:hypothetical protein
MTLITFHSFGKISSLIIIHPAYERSRLKQKTARRKVGLQRDELGTKATAAAHSSLLYFCRLLPVVQSFKKTTKQQRRRER